MAVSKGVNAAASVANALTVSTAAASTTTGSTIVLFLYGDNGPTYTPSDSGGHTWTQIGSAVTDSSGSVGRAYYANNITGSASHTFTTTTNSNASQGVWMVEILGADTSAPLDTYSSADDTSSPFTAGSGFTNAQADEMLISLFGSDTSGTFNPSESTGFTRANALNGSATLWGGASYYKVLSSVQANNASYTDSGTSAGVLFQVGIKGAAGGSSAVLAASPAGKVTLAGGSMSANRPIAGSAAGVVTLAAGSLSAPRPLGASMSGLVTLTGGEMSVSRPLGAQLASIVTLAGQIGLSQPLAADLVTLVTLAGDLTNPGPIGAGAVLSAALSGDVTLLGDLTAPGPLERAVLAAALGGSVTLAGDVRHGIGLGADTGAIITLQANLQIVSTEVVIPSPGPTIGGTSGGGRRGRGRYRGEPTPAPERSLADVLVMETRWLEGESASAERDAELARLKMELEKLQAAVAKAAKARNLKAARQLAEQAAGRRRAVERRRKDDDWLASAYAQRLADVRNIVDDIERQLLSVLTLH